MAFPPLSRFYVILLVAMAPCAVSAAPPTLQEVNQAFRQGKYAAALDKANSFLAINAKDPQGRFLKGLILTELNRTQDAIKVFSGLTDDYPELPEPYNNLAVLFAAQGDYDRSKQSLEMAIRTHPSYATAHENLGDIYAKMASQAYDKALQLDITNVSAQTKLALIRELFSPAPRAQETPGKGKGKPLARPAALTKDTTPPGEPARPVSKPKIDEPPLPVQPVAVNETPAKPIEMPKPQEAAKPVESPKVAEAAKPEETPVAATKPAEPVKKPPAAGKRPKDTLASAEYDVRGWAAAWSAQDVKTYLSHYSPDFKAPKSKKRAEWEEDRRQRISRAEFIRVEIDDLKLAHKGGPIIKAKFKQHYTSNLLDNTTHKTLVLKKHGDAWKIVGEF